MARFVRFRTFLRGKDRPIAMEAQWHSVCVLNGGTKFAWELFSSLHLSSEPVMRVLLAHDSSQYSKAAAEYLLSMPFRKPIDLDVVCAVSPPVVVDSGTLGLPTDLGIFLTEECDAARSRLEESFAHLSSPFQSVQTHVPVGPPSTELLSVAQQTDADLVVLGAVGHSALQRVLLGSVSDYVATHSDTTTLVVRPPHDASVQPKLGRIVVALSGRADDERMIDWLRGLMLPADVEVHLVRILQLPTFYREDIRQKASNYWDGFVKEAQAHILKLETTLQDMGLNTETHLVNAEHVGEGLINYAEQHGCDLIMTGESDSGTLTRVFLGSTSRYVLRHAQCSVMIVRDKHVRQAVKESAATESATDEHSKPKAARTWAVI
tara:strand:- start:149719 stop:150852 length:1134 start_codon:yes stop_codon:yes gene_type:complete